MKRHLPLVFDCLTALAVIGLLAVLVKAYML